MSLFKSKMRFLLLVLMVLSSALVAQERTGNIVEYFGKEKVKVEE